ncbi:ABC transporter ATP-binding protein [bacterium]|nr:ABC transporter ATP-binding protein [bacterium]
MFLMKFAKFLKYFGKGYQIKLVYMAFMSFMTSLLEFLSIVLVFPFIMIMVNPGRVVNNPLALFFIKNFHIQDLRLVILIFGCLIAGAIILKNLYCIFIQYWQCKLTSQWGLEIKEKLLEYFLYAPYETDLQRGDNSIFRKITTNIDEIMKYYVSKVISFFSNSIVILVIFAILIYLLPVFTIIAVIFFTVVGLIQSSFFQKWSMKLSIKKLNLTNGPYNSVVNNLTCIKDIKINGCQRYFYNMYDDISEKVIPFNEKLELIPLMPQYIIEIIFIFTMMILCMGILAKYGEEPQNIIVSMGIVGLAIYRLVPQIYKNQVYINYINITSPKVDELFEIFDRYKVYNYSKNKDTQERINFNNDIIIKELSYSYNKKENVLQNVNLDIKKGEFIGIVGLSGAGKTTLVDCLLGLLEYYGDIYVDNERLNDDNFQKFRNIIGYVPQKITTVDGDIYSNVAWGIERRKIDKQRVEEVLKEAQLYDQLKQTENGLEIELKQDGTGLSGGQMQRIGIARALYRNPEIIVLDEATANLDVKVENKLTEIINNIKGEKTIIAIAHRLSTLANCDRIVYIKDGSVVDVGTFKELSDKHEDFKEIVKLSRIRLDD